MSVNEDIMQENYQFLGINKEIESLKRENTSLSKKVANLTNKLYKFTSLFTKTFKNLIKSGSRRTEEWNESL